MKFQEMAQKLISFFLFLLLILFVNCNKKKETLLIIKKNELSIIYNEYDKIINLIKNHFSLNGFNVSLLNLSSSQSIRDEILKINQKTKIDYIFCDPIYFKIIDNINDFDFKIISYELMISETNKKAFIFDFKEDKIINDVFNLVNTHINKNNYIFYSISNLEGKIYEKLKALEKENIQFLNSVTYSDESINSLFVNKNNISIFLFGGINNRIVNFIKFEKKINYKIYQLNTNFGIKQKNMIFISLNRYDMIKNALNSKEFRNFLKNKANDKLIKVYFDKTTLKIN